MNNFKEFYDKQVNEDIVDVMGDIKDAAVGKLKAKASELVPQGVKNFAGRLFNVENTITDYIKAKKYRDLGKLLIDKKIPQEFKYKRASIFNQTYRDIPLFHVISSLLFFNGDYQKAFADIEAGGNIDIAIYLNQKYNNLDILSFILRIPKLQLDQQALVDKSISPLISSLLKFGFKFDNNMALTTAVRNNSLPLFKSIIENGKIKITPEIEALAQKTTTPDISNYIKSLNVTPGNTSNTNTTPIDLKTLGYDKDLTTKQTLTWFNAKELAHEFTKLIGQPLDKSIIDTIKKDAIAPLLIKWAGTLKYPGINIVVK